MQNLPNAKTDIIAAPKGKATSCGLRKCEGCGVLFNPYYSTNGKKPTKIKKYCSRKCYEKHWKNINADKVKHWQKKWFELNGKEYKKRYRSKNKERLNSQARVLRKNRPKCKTREVKSLFGRFGTSNVSESLKKANALIHLGLRINHQGFGTGNVPSIAKDRVRSIIDRIEKGETYAAYE